jgi:hypothetical protein
MPRLWPRDGVQERYDRDPQFRTVVDMLHVLIRGAQMTPTEVREAAVLATIHYEQTTTRRSFLIPLRNVD